jgi:hypothetical protein
MWPSALRDLPPTRSGDAIRALLATGIFVVVLSLLNVVWPSGSHPVRDALVTGAIVGPFVFAWLRWMHRGTRDAPRESPRA